MKNIKLLLMGFILYLGYSNALGANLPELSTDDTGPWYYIKVLGSSANRKGLVLTAESTDDGLNRVFGRDSKATNIDELYSRLWRVEEAEDGNYVLINRFTGTKLSHTRYVSPKETISVPILTDDPLTTWMIEENTGKPDYVNIVAVTPPEGTSTVNLHQADNYQERGFSLVLEGGWKQDDSSRFTFDLFVDQGIVVTPAEGLDFQYVQLEKDPAQGVGKSISMSVYISPTLGDHVEFINNHKPILWIIDEGMKGGFMGSIDVFFIPQEAKEYDLSFTIKCGETELVVPVKGIGAPMIPIDLDSWYRIQFYKRTGFCMTDKGVDNPLEATVFDANNEAQLWQFQPDGETAKGKPKFKLVNKSGNQIGYQEPAEEGGTGHYIAVASADNTFCFDVRPDGDWQLYWNEYEITDSEGEKTYGTHINKINKEDDNGFTAYKYLPDDGSSIKFYKADETIDIGLPEFSTDTEEYWYYMQFVRVKDKGGLNYGILSSDEINTALGQAEIDPENELLRWKFIGNMNESLIVDINGNEWGVNSTQIVNSGNGNHYKFERFNPGTWKLCNLDNEGVSSRYVNDFGNKANAVGEYSGTDEGSELRFIPINALGIDIPGENIDDPIVNTTYYSLQGIQFASKPQIEGIYIEKNTHASQKTSARKIFIPKK